MNYTTNIFDLFKNAMRKINKTFIILGYSRAASELARQGEYEASKNLMMQLKDFKDKN